jgi:hypothetical protein
MRVRVLFLTSGIRAVLSCSLNISCSSPSHASLGPQPAAGTPTVPAHPSSPHGHDHVLGHLGYILLGDRRHHLLWYRATQGVENHHLLLLIGIAALDDALESPCLQLYLHLESPIRVIGHGEGRVDTPVAYLTNHPLDHDSIFRGVVIGLLSHHLLNND